MVSAARRSLAAAKGHVVHGAERRHRFFLERVAGAARSRSDEGVSLTFDDGPDPEFTPAVLDVLRDLKVRATFFFVGEAVAKDESMVRRTLAEGHGVGSHGYIHRQPHSMTFQELLRDFSAGRALLERVIGADVPLFRPPHGSLTWSSARAVRHVGLSTWLWTIDPEDWRPDATAEGIVSAVERASPGDVIVMHDGLQEAQAPAGADRSATLEALPHVVQTIRRLGLDLEVLPP